LNDWHVPSNNLRYYDFDLAENGTLKHYGRSEEDYQTDVLNQKAVQFVNTQPEPFFLMVSYIGPHDPTIPAKRHSKNKIPPKALLVPPNFSEADVSDKPTFIKDLPTQTGTTYKNLVTMNVRTMASVDESIQHIMDALSTRGILDNTVIFFVTDNGYSNYIHRFLGKSVVYEESIRTPMMIRYPGAQQRDESRLTANIDWNPTITAITGASSPFPVRGLSLVPLLENQEVTWRSDLFLDWRGGTDTRSPVFYAVRTETWKYVEYDTGEKELYDLVNDPYEQLNKANLPDYAAIQDELRQRLAELKAE
jgi:N-acetylglucosamine-6-sulfatase